MKKIIISILALVFVAGALYYFKDRISGLRAPLGKSSVKVENGESLPLILPAGFSAAVYAKDLDNPRVMIRDPWGNILTSVPGRGEVIALIDGNGDGFAETHAVVASDLKNPHGLATRCFDGFCKLYIAETDEVAEYDFDEQNMRAINKKKLFDLPTGGSHFTRTIMFEPYPNDSKMLVSVGSSCNVCHEEDSRRAKILEYDFQTGKLVEFAAGLRNSVFMAIHPVTGEIWATEMGRDLLGDDIPPDEINIIRPSANSGQNSIPNFGWPICYGKNIHDDNFDKNVYIRNPCMEPFETPSHIDIPAHSAPLGLAFFPEEGWPEEYWHNLLVAYHGSWNRSTPAGYKIVRYKLDTKGNYLGEEDFISGFLDEKGVAWGRPVDIIIEPGGTIYVSDDKAGAIYKIIPNR